MTYERIIGDLKKKIYSPVYFLSGVEPFYIDAISGYIEKHVLSDSEKEFNLNIIYGIDVDTTTIISYARRFPLMANYQILIVKEAQNIKDIEDLNVYIKNPVETTILVICYKYKKIDARKSFAKLIKENSVFFESKKLYDYKIPNWISSYLKQKDYSITPKASMLLTEYLGNDLSKISNELDKLLINKPAKTEINDAIVEENTGISKDYNIFELQNALGKMDVYKANRICNYFAANEKENPIVRTIALLYIFFSKVMIYHRISNKSRNNVASVLSINPFFVNDFQLAAKNYNHLKLSRIIAGLQEYDLKAKGYGNVSTSHGELLKELIYKILH